MNTNTKKILTAGAIALSMILTGCSSTSTNTKDAKTTEVAKKNTEKKTLGQKTSDSKTLKVTNKTGKKITVFETKSSSEESFSDNLLQDGDAVKNKEERTLYYTLNKEDKLNIKVGLQNEDKTYVFKEVDTSDTKKMDVSFKEDKINLDVTKKDGSTATLTPAEDETKTDDEKKDEEEVKSEEKKEETASKSDSNKSNSSESKKENTASNTNKNNSSNSSKPSGSNSGSSSSSSKPAEHQHNWVAITETRTVVDQAAYDEQVPQYSEEEHQICNQCGADITGNAVAHNEQHLANYEKGGYHSELKQVLTGYQTVHHPAVTHTETVTTGYRCSTCGATK